MTAGHRDVRRPGPRERPTLRPELLVCLVLALLTLGCEDRRGETDVDAAPAPPPAAPTQAAGDVFDAFIRQPTSIVPTSAIESDDLIVVGQLFEPLTRVTPAMGVAPAAAASWEANEDATVFTFHLRPGATFHDGSPVTAESFVRAWRRIVDRTAVPASPSDYLLELVVGYESAREGGAFDGLVAVDDETLEVRLRTPFVEWPLVVSHPALSPLPARVDRDPDFRRVPVGNGPFRMAEPWQPGRYIRLEPYPAHPAASRHLDQVLLRIYEGADAVERAYEDFLRGTLDLAPVPEGVQADAIRRFGRSSDGHAGPGVIDGLRATTVFYAFNTEIAPFDDVTVRRAIALLVERDTFAEPAGRTVRAPAVSIVPPVFGDYVPPPCAYCAPDLAEAERILEEAEIEALDPMTLVHLDTDEHRAVAEAVAQSVNRVLGSGVLRPVGLDYGAWLEAVRGGEAGFFLGGWVAEYPSPGAILDHLFHPDRAGGDNLTRLASQEIAALFDEVRREPDARRREALYHEIEAIVLDEAVVLPISFYRHARVVSQRTVGLRVDPFGRMDLARVSLRDDDG